MDYYNFKRLWKREDFIEMGKLVDLIKENTITATATGTATATAAATATATATAAATTTTNNNWGVVACELFLSTLP